MNAYRENKRLIISIHALREEGDFLLPNLNFWNKISIHALREEGDKAGFDPTIKHKLFLSTPSARRATCVIAKINRGCNDFYPRPPRGGRPRSFPRHDRTRSISIHALREEGDPLLIQFPGAGLQFLSTPSARRATLQAGTACKIQRISIHALREEGDLAKLNEKTGLFEFLSTPSARRATIKPTASTSNY